MQMGIRFAIIGKNKIKLMLLISICLIFIQKGTCQGNKLTNCDLIKKELLFFMDTVPKIHSDWANKHLVFLIKFDSANYKSNSFILTLGYTFNLDELLYIKVTHLFMFNNYLVLSSGINMSIEKDIQSCLKIKKIETNDSLIIKKTLINNNPILADYIGMVTKRNKDKVIRKLYNSASEIPRRYSIYNTWPENSQVYKVK